MKYSASRSLRLISNTKFGFTLLEIIVVLAIMGFLAAMVLPAIGLLNNAQKSKATRTVMEDIRTAIIGPRDNFDEEGRPVAGGYVGDMGALPDLWQTTNGQFDSGETWAYLLGIGELEEVSSISRQETYTMNEGQPRGLWTDNPGPNATDNLSSRWSGPYMHAPTDAVPNNHRHLAKTTASYNGLDGSEAVTDDASTDKEKFRQVMCPDKFSDAWGRALRFFIEESPNETFWIISAGPDGKIYVPSAGIDDDYRNVTSSSDPKLANLDNIEIKILVGEWQGNIQQKTDDTRRQMENIRQAIIGSPGSTKKNTYIGDLTSPPELYYRFGEVSSTQWEGKNDQDDLESADEGENEIPQPRGLWTQNPSLGSDPALQNFENGIGWRTQYMSEPWGDDNTGADRLLRDAWSTPFLFYYENASSPLGDLTIVSAGPDGLFDEIDDNIELILSSNDWSSGSLDTVSFIVLGAKDNSGTVVTKAIVRSSSAQEILLQADLDPDFDSVPNPDEWDITNLLNISPMSVGSRWLVVWDDDETGGIIDEPDGNETIRIIELDIFPSLPTSLNRTISMP